MDGFLLVPQDYYGVWNYKQETWKIPLPYFATYPTFRDK